MTKRIKRPVGRGLAVAKAGRRRTRTIRVSVCGGPDLLIKVIPVRKSRIENPKSKIQ